MKKFTNLLLGTALLASVTSCDSIEVDDGKYAEDVVGTYISNDIDSSLNGYEDETATLVVTEVNDTLADINISFDNALISDLDLPSVVLSSGSGDDIDLDKQFSNATALGYVNGDSIRLKIDYTDGDFIDFRGSK